MFYGGQPDAHQIDDVGKIVFVADEGYVVRNSFFHAFQDFHRFESQGGAEGDDRREFFVFGQIIADVFKPAVAFGGSRQVEEIGLVKGDVEIFQTGSVSRNPVENDAVFVLVRTDDADVFVPQMDELNKKWEVSSSRFLLLELNGFPRETAES